MPSTRLSDAMRVALAPEATYAQLTAERHDATWSRALAGPVAYGLVIGIALSIAATNVASIPSVIGVAIFWSFVPAVQLFTAWIVCRHPPRSNVTTRRALELLFVSHLPWSLWLIGFAASTFWFLPGPGFLQALLAAVLAPILWTPVLIAAFCRAVLGCSAREARWRTFRYQGITWAVIAVLSVLADQIWARFGGGA